MQKKFTHVILGGTFDHFHAGHKDFISSAISQSEHVTIGLTTETLYQHKPFASSIQSFTERKEAIEQFLKTQDSLQNTHILPLTDIYGNSLIEEKIDAIFVTPDTEKTAHIINTDRQKKGWSVMQVIIVPLKKGPDGNIIASARIRQGEIDRLGNPYISLFLDKDSYHLPELLRDRLRIPLGEVVAENTVLATMIKNKIIISVGDIITASLVEMSIQPAVSIFDLTSERKEITDKNILDNLPNPLYVLSNKPTTIEQDVVIILQKSLNTYVQTKEKYAINIIGEEDLLTLPAILLAPLDAIILYGQKDTGVIAVTVTEEKKAEIKTLIKQFV